jgi:hypothetical protein
MSGFVAIVDKLFNFKFSNLSIELSSLILNNESIYPIELLIKFISEGWIIPDYY